MRYLLDTHSLIWFIGGNSQLGTKARKLMDEVTNDLFVSVATLWEMAVKFSVGKLILSQPFEELFPPQLENNSIKVIGITVDHLKVVCNLFFHHRNPFDR